MWYPVVEAVEAKSKPLQRQQQKGQRLSDACRSRRQRTTLRTDVAPSPRLLQRLPQAAAPRQQIAEALSRRHQLLLPRQQRQIGAVVLWRRRQQHLVVQSPIGAAPWQPRRGTSQQQHERSSSSGRGKVRWRHHRALHQRVAVTVVPAAAAAASARVRVLSQRRLRVRQSRHSGWTLRRCDDAHRWWQQHQVVAAASGMMLAA